MNTYYLYIMASGRNGTLYTGVTNDLARRVAEHKSRRFPGFTDKYGVTNLVWYQEFQDIRDANSMEKRLKRWHRKWKMRLIEEMNPDWRDLGEWIRVEGQEEG
jgi:putative endonuclease